MAEQASHVESALQIENTNFPPRAIHTGHYSTVEAELALPALLCVGGKQAQDSCLLELSFDKHKVNNA